jgi:hypothetical protein
MHRNDISKVNSARARNLPMTVSNLCLRILLDAVCFHNAVVSARLMEVGSRNRLIFVLKLYLLICSFIYIYMPMHEEQEK